MGTPYGVDPWPEAPVQKNPSFIYDSSLLIRLSVSEETVRPQIPLYRDWKRDFSRCSKMPNISCSGIKMGFSLAEGSGIFVSLMYKTRFLRSPKCIPAIS